MTRTWRLWALGALLAATPAFADEITVFAPTEIGGETVWAPAAPSVPSASTVALREQALTDDLDLFEAMETPVGLVWTRSARAADMATVPAYETVDLSTVDRRSVVGVLGFAMFGPHFDGSLIATASIATASIRTPDPATATARLSGSFYVAH